MKHRSNRCVLYPQYSVRQYS